MKKASGDSRILKVTISPPEPLSATEKAILVPGLIRRGLTPAMLDLMLNIPQRTRLVKVFSDSGELCGLTSILLTPRIFMKHVFGEGNHLGTNNTFYFAGNVAKAAVLEAVFRELTRIRRLGIFVGFIDPEYDGEFYRALHEIPHLTARKVLATGSIATGEPDSATKFFKRHEHLTRQINRFRNKGGAVHVLEGKVPSDLAESFVTCCRISYQKHLHPGGSIDIERYAGHVRDFLLTCPETVHIYATIDGEVIGVQTFIRHIRHLELTEGGFADHRQTYHAYENIIVASVKYAVENHLEKVSYGLISNPAKDRLMDTTTRQPIYLIMIFRSWLAAGLLWPYKFWAHRRFPLPYWRKKRAS